MAEQVDLLPIYGSVVTIDTAWAVIPDSARIDGMRDTIVDGRVLMRERQLLTIDEHKAILIGELLQQFGVDEAALVKREYVDL